MSILNMSPKEEKLYNAYYKIYFELKNKRSEDFTLKDLKKRFKQYYVRLQKMNKNPTKKNASIFIEYSTLFNIVENKIMNNWR